MLERNRTFGRVSRPVDKASAPRQALGRQRKTGYAKNATTVAQATRFRDVPRAVAGTAPPIALMNDHPVPNVTAADPVLVPAVSEPVLLADDVTTELLAAVDAAAPVTVDAVATFEPRADTLTVVIDVADTELPAASAAPVLSVAMDPAARPTPRRAARRSPFLRLAVAASVALAGLLAFGHFSNAHRSVPAPPSLATILPAAPAASADAVAPAAEASPRAAAPALLPLDAPTLPPLLATAAYGTDDLVEAAALPPSNDELLTARAVAASEKAEAQSGSAAPRKPAAAKPVASRNAAPRARQAAASQRTSSGPILDFLSGLIP